MMREDIDRELGDIQTRLNGIETLAREQSHGGEDMLDVIQVLASDAKAAAERIEVAMRDLWLVPEEQVIGQGEEVRQ